MAVLSKIRQRSLLLILVIGFCLFAFIIGDVVQSGGFNSVSREVGSINGKDISYDDFNLKVANVEKSGQGLSLTQAANRVWEQEVNVALLQEQFEKLGIRVGERHILEVFKNNPQIGQNPTFQTAGVFDINKFKEFFRSNPQQEVFLKEAEKDAAINAQFEIYSSMIRGAAFATDVEGKLKYQMENDKVTFNYVAVPFSSIKDSDVKVTDEEIVAYMRENEKKYKAEESREIEYVLIEDKPSKADEDEVKKNIDALMEGKVVYNEKTGTNDTVPGFRNTANIIDFVNENSDFPYDSTYIAKSDLPAEVQGMFDLPVGGIYGPYMRGGFYAVSKVMGRKAGAKAKASHILISYEGTAVPNKKEKRTKEEAKAKAESLLSQAKANPSGFMMLALVNSDDSSAQQGGDLGYFGPNQMVKPFNDFVFNNPVGTIGLVETDFGFHVINVTDKQDAIRVATLAQRIEPSEATSNEAFNKAAKFEMDANEKDFAATAKAAGLTVAPPVVAKVMDENFGSIGNQRQIVRWAYEKNTDAGDVKRFEIANVGHVIARLKKINDEGLMAVDQARISIEPILKNKKKTEIIKKKLQGSNLEAMAKAAGVQVQQALDMTVQNAVLPNVGPEPRVVGTALSIGQGKTSGAIEGNSGVYVVSTVVVTKAADIKDFAPMRQQIMQSRAGDAGRVIPALKANAEIEDNRWKFNY